MYKREKKGFVPTRHLMSGHKQIFSTLSRDVVVYFVLFDSFIYYTRSIMYSLLLFPLSCQWHALFLFFNLTILDLPYAITMTTPAPSRFRSTTAVTMKKTLPKLNADIPKLHHYHLPTQLVKYHQWLLLMSSTKHIIMHKQICIPHTPAIMHNQESNQLLYILRYYDLVATCRHIDNEF